MDWSSWRAWRLSLRLCVKGFSPRRQVTAKGAKKTTKDRFMDIYAGWGLLPQSPSKPADRLLISGGAEVASQARVLTVAQGVPMLT